MPEAMELGTRIAAFRERLGLSRAELAANAGVAAGVVEAVEEGRAYPPLGTLLKLARALGQRPGTFMDDHYREDPLVVRASDRQREAPDAVTGPYRYFSLGRGKTDRHMEPLFIEVAPDPAEAPSSHEGEEFLIVLAGEVVVQYGDAVHTLGPGDTMYYNSIVPHLVRAGGGRPASLCAVIFQPF
ncbi:cupin domain-containing protein [Mesoterricola silvestris]|uniref:DNA-binding protein n=1 Tax=Mesoterricola silvestris TaxID=2927979 RepID=A0AA48GMU5_9BACT|nr:cupin domain-containing protein [Mesoterricola silvestris]BDU72764.1 DNA-binding protein [Mesoterricola silvestris]